MSNRIEHHFKPLLTMRRDDWWNGVKTRFTSRLTPLLQWRVMTVPDLTAASVRLDLWLWAARFHKTRALAKQAIETGKVEVGGQRAKPSRVVRIGDVLHITRGEEVFQVDVAGLSNKRGPAKVAQTLYVESETSRLQREALRATRAAQRAGYDAPEGKPDKRARRLIRALGDIDAT